MLVTRRRDTDHSHWNFSKCDPALTAPSSIRMSNPYEAALSVQSEWQGQHQYSQTNGSAFQPQTTLSQPNSSKVAGNALGIHIKEEMSSPKGHRLPHITGSEETHLSLSTTSLEVPNRDSGLATSDSVHENACGVKELIGQYTGAASQSSGMSNGREPLASPSVALLGEKTPSMKSDEEEDFEDDDILDGDGDQSSQSVADRAAARRKMKRFRLTHQQTRFLMSEFAKQPHPDAAHRDRLSREIPGLSPRQVQVWFQNSLTDGTRRAKIKRLNVDDRDRMIKMRAVPDDFDNLQALHSQYGAVHGLGPSMNPARDLEPQSYAQHMMRPLMVDVRRVPNEHPSPSGLTPGFGGLGFGSAGGINSPAVMSPISPANSDRYPHGSHFSTPINGTARTSLPFSNQSGMASPLDASRQIPHPLQPPQLHDPISRARSESGQSPLRSSMSWKGGSIDYGGYRGANNSPNMDGRNSPMYQSGNMGTYESAPFSNTPTQSPSSLSYPAVPPPQARSRLRSATSSLPLSVTSREYYRTLGSDAHGQSPSSQARSTPISTPYSAASYVASYPSAPLTAPMEYSVARASDLKSNFQEPQLSAPIAPPSDFSRALHGAMGRQDRGRNEGNIDSISSREGHKRKRSLTLPAGATRPLF
ncbi:hypothetical protein BGZ63DRAFT_404194 [Mariannaea sp. PMI_226]|nr:hypothetical protein BGZ63DRAFT_404194 [Mariannaea sp. PMI_226]